MVFNVHAGHNPAGMIAHGAVGIIDESAEDRKVKDAVITKLRQLGHTVYDCTCNDGTSQNNVLSKIVKQCNSHTVDWDISIHFNAGANDTAGNGVSCGTECWVYTNSGANDKAAEICAAIAKLGFRNRGVKESKSLYVLNATKAKAILVECCFVDDADDVNLYKANGVDSFANAIVTGLVGATPSATTTTATATATTTTTTTTKKSVSEIADEVINGNWGNGTDRRTRLTNAGYNPDEVQAAVNAKLNKTTVKKSIEEIAREVIKGLWGNGATRKEALKKAGYDPDAVQTMVNAILK